MKVISYILLGILLGSVVRAQEENCKTPYLPSEEPDTGCKECTDGPFFKKNVTPTDPSSSSSVSLRKWTCLRCPNDSISCKFESNKVTIDSCQAKFYLEKGDAVDDSCKKCPE